MYNVSQVYHVFQITVKTTYRQKHQLLEYTFFFMFYSFKIVVCKSSKSSMKKPELV